MLYTAEQPAQRGVAPGAELDAEGAADGKLHLVSGAP